MKFPFILRKKGTNAVTKYTFVPKVCILAPKRYILVPKVYILVPKWYVTAFVPFFPESVPLSYIIIINHTVLGNTAG